MSLCEMVETLKLYFLHNMRESERERKREAMSMCEMLKTLKQSYLHKMRERERLCPYVKP